MLVQTDPTDAPSKGQRLLPYLFAGMEACCLAALLVGLADVHFLGVGMPLLPLWAVFVVIVGACWCERFWQYSSRGFSGISLGGRVNGVCLLIVAIIFAALAVPWIINVDALHAVAAFLIFVFLCYRGFRIAERESDPAYATRALGFGLGALLGAIFLQLIGPAAGVTPYRYGDLFLLLFTLIFLFLLLMARSLSHISFVRQGHRSVQDDEGSSIRAQERAVMQMVVVLSLIFLLVALASASFVNPGMLAYMQQFVNAGYVWGTHAFATVIAIILSPIVWLLQLIHFKSAAPIKAPQRHIAATVPPGGALPASPAPVGSTFTLPLVIEIIALVALILLATALYIWLARRVLRRRVRQPAEQRESLWSWSLFWLRVKAFWQALFARLPVLRGNGSGQLNADAITLGHVSSTLSARDIRGIYHALLKRAARLGYPRQRGETPFEFEQRLEQQLPAVRPQLATITELYVAARYGGYQPGETEIEYLRDLWLQLERDWQA